MLRQAEVIIRAKIQNLAAILYLDPDPLRRADKAFRLVSPCVSDSFELSVDMVEKSNGIVEMSAVKWIILPVEMMPPILTCASIRSLAAFSVAITPFCPS